MTELEAISALERLLHMAAGRGLDMSSSQKFFDVGEWLLAFEGPWFYALANPEDEIVQNPDYQSLLAYFGPYLEA